MKHRHLDADPTTPVTELGLAALDDLLERGDLDDWQPVLAELGRDPFGPVADRVLRLGEGHPLQGTSALLRSWLISLRERAAEPAVGPWLASLRRARGLTQKRVADRLGTTQPEISRIESRRDLRLATVRAYVRALDGELEVAALVGGTRGPLA